MGVLLRGVVFYSWLGLVAASAFAQGPALELVLQTGHSRSVTSVSLSADGKWLATGSRDGTAILWNVSTGAKLRTFEGQFSTSNRVLANDVSDVTLSNDATRLLTMNLDLSLILWDAVTGRRILTFDGPQQKLSGALLSRNGDVLATLSNKTSITLWNARTGARLRTIEGKADSRHFVSLSSDGSRLLTVEKNSAVLWDTASGERHRAIEAGEIKAVVLTGDGRLVFTATGFGQAVVWNAETGARVRTFGRMPQDVTNAHFSDDGEWLAKEMQNQSVMWTRAEGQAEVTSFSHECAVYCAALSSDGGLLATGTHNGEAIVWNTTTREKVRVFSDRVHEVKQVSASFDARRIVTVTGDENAAAILWDATTSDPPRVFQGTRVVENGLSNGRPIVSDRIGAASLSRDGKRLLLGDYDGKAKLIDAATGTLISTGEIGRDAVYSAGLNGSATHAATGFLSWDYGVTLWDLRTNVKKVLKGHQDAVGGIALSDDGRRVLSTTLGGAILWDAAAGTQLRTFHGHKDRVTATLLSPNGKRVATGGFDKAVILWDADTGAKVRAFPGHDGPIRGLALSADGRWMATVSDDRKAILWDTTTGARFRTYEGHTGPIWCVALSADATRMITGGGDGTTRLWDTVATRELCRLISIDAGKDWLVVTPEGLFDGSINARSFVAYRVAGTIDFVPLERFQQKYYQPGLLASILRGENPQPKQNIARSLPPVVRFTSPAQSGVDVASGTVEVKVTAEARGGSPIRTLRLLVDGRPYKGQYGVYKVEQPQAMSVAATWEVELDPGRHTLKVLADTEFVQGASDEIEVKYTGGGIDLKNVARPKLYVLAIGVSNYAGTRRLDYAAKDAQELADAFASKSRGLYEDVETKLVLDEKATQDEIFAGLLWLREKMSGSATGIVYFGGHAEVDKVDNSLYLLPVNFQERNLAGTAIDAERFRKQLMAIPGRLVLMLDACHAGAIGGDGRTRGAGRLTDLLVRDLTAEENGLVVMCSALGHEQSQESNQFRHGLFTWAVLEALREGKADKTDGAVYLSALDSYVAKRVKQLSKGRQNPVTGKPTSIRDFPLSRP